MREDDDSRDRLRRRLLWKLPTGLYLLGSRSGEQRNLMTASWVIQVATEPKLLAASVEAGAYTHALVSDGGAFAVSLLRREDRAIVRRFVKPAAWDQASGSLNGFEVTEGPTGAPILKEAAAWLDCSLRNALPLGSHTVFMGEIVGFGAPGGEEFDVLRMEDTRMNYGG